jgi:predicted nucleic acid-binding protein
VVGGGGMNVRFIDTSIMTNLLIIPNRNERHAEIKREFSDAVNAEETLILPLSTIIETGNHIAHIDDGRIRRKIAGLFSEYLRKMAGSNPPWTLYGNALTVEDINHLAGEFPDMAMREVGFGDLSIIRCYNTYKDTVPGIGRIMIWSADGHLSGYIENLTGMKRRRHTD